MNILLHAQTYANNAKTAARNSYFVIAHIYFCHASTHLFSVHHVVLKSDGYVIISSCINLKIFMTKNQTT